MIRLIIYTVIIIVFLSGCSSSQLINQYKNPEIYTFEANKVLIIGMTADKDLRRTFEKKLAEAFDKEKVIAVKSVDFFEKSFVNRAQTIEELNAIESQLFEAGFDAILLTKVTGQKTKVSLVAYYNTYAEKFRTFEDYYYGNQNVFFEQEEEHYIVYSTETSLYCICPGKERELLWQGVIEVTKAVNSKKNVNDYTKVLLKSLKENELLIL